MSSLPSFQSSNEKMSLQSGHLRQADTSDTSHSITPNEEETKVIIIGCGPTGALLSALLGRLSVPNIVLEKETEIVSDPRGIALDEDGIRILQDLGLYDKVYTEIGQSIEWLHFTSGKHGLNTKPFLRVNLNTTEGGTGHVGAISHRQPVMEKYIRSAAQACDGSQIRLGSEVMAIEEDKSSVTVTYTTSKGTTKKVRGHFLVGADGKTGYTRKKYLEPRGITMDLKPGYEYQETWVAVNWHITPPTRETHPKFPLWSCGYSPEEVYDLFFPRNFRFIGNPDRPSVCGCFGRREEHLWRFEFVVGPGEDPNLMATEPKVAEIIDPYLTHRGDIYGLSEPVSFPKDCIEVIRSRPFSFAARSCNKWALGRVILCGDAAHVMPPFGGQGIASGFRDASGLAWRLALVCRSEYEKYYDSVLEGWYLERKQQLDRSIATTVSNGNFCTARNPVKIFFRDWVLWFMHQIPSLRKQLELGPRLGGMVRYNWSQGMAFLPQYLGGRCLPQVYSRPLSVSSKSAESQTQFTDDVIFQKDKRMPFQLVILVDNLRAAETAFLDLKAADLESISRGTISGKEATCIIHDPSLGPDDVAESPTAFKHRLHRIATAEEFAACGVLCKDRPMPIGYDMYQMREDMKRKTYVIVRPDRFVFAACQTIDELVQACRAIEDTVFCRVKL